MPESVMILIVLAATVVVILATVLGFVLALNYLKTKRIGTDPISQLLKLKEMMDSGQITKEEFALFKEKLE